MQADCLRCRAGACEIGLPESECTPACSTYLRRQPVEIYTRVMGYHRPVAFFNAGKKQEHADRRHFMEPCNV
ncbi:MAG: hypothetical protein GY788_07575 [bacterium]|nr:hypothetical protein [bacterium]